MIRRQSIGVVGSYHPTFSVPSPVEDHFWVLVHRLPPDVEINIIGRGCHNAGWQYLEVEVIALSPAHAFEIAERICGEVMAEFQWRQNA